MKKKVVFYNPSAPYYTMPLQFLALASVIDRRQYDIEIVDARIEPSPAHAHEKVKALLAQAVCVGISVITGTAIKDAVAVSKMVKMMAPDVPVVWGGWHPSIYPEQCLREGYADFCVLGQGEMTFLELLEAIEANSGFDKVLGLAYHNNNEVLTNPERKFIDISRFPSYDYELLDLETYFRFKGRRQIDFYSSQGCPYRCAFCADPTVYGRRWSGLKGARMIDDVFEPVSRHGVTDVVFQDENFFANRNRVVEFCEAVNARGMKFTWVATSRADQIAPLDDNILAEISAAHLRKVVIGVESGSQEMLDFMKKDTLAEEAEISAEKLARHGIGATFNFIVGFPEESFDETLKTLRVIRNIKRVNPEFEFNIFFFTPYPGTELFEYIVRKGYNVPQSLSEWSDIDFTVYAGYWVKEHERRHIERFQFYTKLATEQRFSRSVIRPLRYLARARTRSDYFGIPIEKGIIDFFRNTLSHHGEI